MLRCCMDHNVTSLERAFALAKSGRCRSIADIRNTLKAEGYSHAQVTGRVVIKQLNEFIDKSRKKDA
jgi:hypothetical protein